MQRSRRNNQTTGRVLQADLRSRYVAGSLHWWQGQANKFAVRLVSHVRQLDSFLLTWTAKSKPVDRSDVGVRTRGYSRARRLCGTDQGKGGSYVDAGDAVKGCCDEDDGDVATKTTATYAVVLLFAKGSGTAALQSVAVDELLLSPSFPYRSRLTFGCCCRGSRCETLATTRTRNNQTKRWLALFGFAQGQQMTLDGKIVGRKAKRSTAVHSLTFVSLFLRSRGRRNRS
jgi:hypothetical protein